MRTSVTQRIYIVITMTVLCVRLIHHVASGYASQEMLYSVERNIVVITVVPAKTATEMAVSRRTAIDLGGL